MSTNYHEAESFNSLALNSASLKNHKFIDCSFEGCTFENCKIGSSSFVSCSFNNCTIINPESHFSEIKNSTFEGCNLIGVVWGELCSAEKFATPIGTFKNCCLKYNTFYDMNLIKFNFSGNIIQDSLFEKCNLKESNFRYCRLDKTTFLQCNLTKADFREAMGYVVDIKTNLMKNARFSFPEVTSLLNTLDIKID